MSNNPHDHPQQPEVLEAQWDRERIADLFDDLDQGADVKHVQVRSTQGKSTEDSSVTLEQAWHLFQNDEAKAIQIYYDFDGESWCDTLMVTPDHVHIIRTRTN